jgi:2-methylcitrate dehydratase PrpD
MAEKLRINGRELITAIVIGYDVAIRVSLGAFAGMHSDKGWHGTGTCGSFGAAAGAGKLLGLDGQELTWALGLAGSYTGGIWAFLSDGAMSKRMHPGMASMHGVISAYLAKTGFTGPTKVLEAEFGGFYKTYMHDNYDLEVVLKRLGSEFMILKTGVKMYASCRAAHGAIDAVKELKDRYDIKAEDVSEVTVEVNDHVARLCGNKEIRTILDAQMSIPYSVATILVRGNTLLEGFSPEALHKPEMNSIMNRIKIAVNPALKETKVAVLTKKGGQYQAESKIPLGDPQNMPTSKDIESKFSRLACTVYGSDQIQSVIEAVNSLENVDNITSLCKNLTIQSVPVNQA